MAKARQQYFADEVTLQKESREFAIEPELIEKLDSIETGAQVNVIETVKVNGEALTPDEDKAVDVSVPLVEDTLYSTDTDKALSANQGKVLYEYIQNLASRGRYLSNWNAVTGLPSTSPVDNPYQYRAGDYYVVSNVAALGGTNYRPDGSSYSWGVASTTVETETVKVGDYYTYDGQHWLLLVNTAREIAIDSSLSTTSTNPVENRVVTNALNTKQNNITDLETIRSGAALGATALQPGAGLSELTGTSDDIAQGTTNLFMTTAERSKLSNQSGVNTGDETQLTIKNKLGQASASTDGYLTSTDWNAFNNKQGTISDLETIRSNASAGKNASDTIATYGDVVTHDANEFATASQGAKADTALQSGDNVSELVNDAGYITDAYHDSTKQDKLIAGANIQIAADGKTISATDTTYVAGDFDIKDLADTTGLRTEWSGKQDELIAGNNIQIAADGKTISATDTTYTAGPGISISNNNVISNTQTSAEWGNITGTLSDQTDLNTALGGKQDTLIAGANIQIASDGKTVSATDTTYTAGTGISIDSNNVISSTQSSAEWGNITGTLSDQTDLQSALDAKQDDMVILKYGISTWNDFITAYQKNGVVYCRASSQSNPATGTQGRLAFMAYVNNADNPTEVEFQYYRSRSDHNSAANQLDEVYVYKLVPTSGGTWTVTQRNTAAKAVAGTGIGLSFGSGNMTISNSGVTSVNGDTGAVTLNIPTVPTNVSDFVNDAGYITANDLPTVDTAMSDSSTNAVQNNVIKNYVDTQVQEATSGAVSDTAYGDSWNGITGIAPSKNAVYDKISAMDTTIAGKQDTISDLSTIRTGAGKGATAVQPGDNVSTLTNDAGFITKAVSDLTNYYTKSETYTKAEVADYVANFAGFKVVATLPTTDIKTTIIYLLGPVGTGADKYEEYIYSNNAWVKIGETSVDLTNYFNTSTDNSDSITEGSTNLFLTSAERTKLSNTSGTNTGDETKATIQSKLGAATSSNDGYLTSADWSTFNGKANAADANTKTFFWVGTPSTAEGLEVWNWVSSGKNAVIAYRTQAGELVTEYMMTQYAQRSGSFSGFATFESVGTPGTTLDYGGTYSKSSRGYINIAENGTVTMTTLGGNINYLATDVDYSTVYTPTYDGSPATKKYVDDSIPTYIAGSNVTITENCESDMQGPCDSGFHVPLKSEWEGLKTIMTSLSLTTGAQYKTNLHMPFVGYRAYSDGLVRNQANSGDYWASNIEAAGRGNAYYMSLYSSDRNIEYNYFGYGYSIRAFKNEYVAPTSSWTVIAGTLGNAGIFWNSTDGLITVTNGTTGYTIQDKNVGATTVYNDGDTLSEANMGNLFQRGNNYGFSSSTSVTPTTSTTQVDTSSYGPENPYYSSTYIIDNKNWQSTTNGDLWGGESLGTHCQSTISSNANYIAGSNVTIEEVCESDMRGPAPSGYHVPLNTEWQTVYDIWTALGGGSSDGTNFGIALKLPFAGLRNYSSAGVIGQGTFGNYWSSSRYNASYAYLLNFNSTALNPQSYSSRAYGYSVRCFKNSPTVPTSTWTKLYGTSIESGGIFWSSADGLISLSSNGQTWITIADKNLGATTVWNSGDTLSEANCGKYYQWGNNYGFARTGSVTTSSTQVDASNYGPGNYYSSSTFIIYEGRWDTTDNGNLRGGVSQLTQCSNVISATDNKATWGNITGTLADQTDLNTVLGGKQDTLTAGSNVTIENICSNDMQGPCPDGFHVPLNTEWQTVYDIWTALGGGSSDGTNFGIALKLPCAGSRRNYNSSVYGQGSQGFYWSSSPYPSDADYSYHLAFFSTNINPQYNSYRALGYSVRCFKDTPIIPTSSWTKLYGTSIEAGGIFWSSTDGLISLSSDGTTWITISDKNLGATTVWNNGDTLSEANGGKYYQWGNNYGFAWTGSLTTSGTQVDASNYGPGNYYSSSTFITGNNDRSSVQNNNLWGGVSQGTQCGNMISATDTTYESKTAASGGTDVSLVTTGEKYTWNNKANASDITAKTYVTSGTMDSQTFMAILNGLATGITPIIIYQSNTIEEYYYESGTTDTSGVSLYFYSPSNGVDNGTLYNKKLTIFMALQTATVTLTKSNENLAVGGGDMSYSDFGWQAKTGTTITLDLASTYTPSANFTVNAPSTIKDGQTYILRVNNGSTAYTMTLGTNVTNPYSTSTTLTANGVDQFVFLAIGGNLELQPEGGGGGIAPAANSPINVKYIWAGTEAQYKALSSYDDNTVYFTV